MYNFWARRADIFYFWLSMGMLSVLFIQIQQWGVLPLVLVVLITLLGASFIYNADTVYRHFAGRYFSLKSGDIALYRDATQVLPLCVIRGSHLIVFKGLKPMDIDLKSVYSLALKDDETKAIEIIEAKDGLRLEFLIDAGSEQNQRLYQLINKRRGENE